METISISDINSEALSVLSFKDLVENGSFNEEIAVCLGNLIFHGFSTVIAGGAGSGKTSLLNALSGCIPNDEYTATIENKRELLLPQSKHVASITSYSQFTKKYGEYTDSELVRKSLHMRPDRIVVGEILDGAAYDLLQAMSAGHEGSLTTMHVNSLNVSDTIDRLVLLVSNAGDISPERVLAIIAAGVDLIITIGYYEDGSRRVSGVYEVPKKLTLADGVLSINPIPLWRFIPDITDEKGIVQGHYAKVNELSEDAIQNHGLKDKKWLTLAEIYEISAYEKSIPSNS